MSQNEGFAQVYQEHRQGLFTMALSVTRDQASAEDAVHEAFVRLLRIEGEDHTIKDFTAYAYGAVRRAAIDQVRRRGKRVMVHESIFDDSAVTQPCAIDRAEEDALLRQAVERLPDDERCCVVMRIYGELTFHQMSEALGDPVSTISSRYQRALEQLRRILSVKQEAM